MTSNNYITKTKYLRIRHLECEETPKNLKTENSLFKRNLVSKTKLPEITTNNLNKIKNNTCLLYKQRNEFLIIKRNAKSNANATHFNKFENTLTSTSPINLKIPIIHTFQSLNYTTGNKYLISGVDNLFSTHTKIKQKVFDETTKKYFQYTDDTPNKFADTNEDSCNSYVKKILNKNYRNNNTKKNEKKRGSLVFKDNNATENEEQPKLFQPCIGMNTLRRKVELKLEDPYLFLNRTYARNQAVNYTPVMVNVFNSNQSKLNHFYSANNK